MSPDADLCQRIRSYCKISSPVQARFGDAVCYSARVWSDYRKYVREYGADVSVKEFYDLYWLRANGAKVSVQGGMDASFKDSQGEGEKRIEKLVEQHHARLRADLTSELTKQQQRLEAADLALSRRPTKTAAENKRIATDKIEAISERLAQLDNSDRLAAEERIFPGTYAPVLAWVDGRRQVLPMRYGCRPAGKPADYDTRFPGTYNARRDNLDLFWRGQFGHTHGVVVAGAFFENVPRHMAEGRPLRPGEMQKSAVVAFRANPPEDLLLACLWSRWCAPGEPDLLSFALITDEPPPEVLAAGHDRCVIPLRRENLDAWLNPDPKDLLSAFRLLDDRQPVTFAHTLVS